jgi:hypothetical protein
MRRIALALLIYLLLGPLPASQLPRPPLNNSQLVTARAVPDVPLPTRIGALTLTEAWEISGRNSRFGGLSGMMLIGPRRFAMVGDTGRMLRLTLSRGGQVDGASMTELPPLRAALTSKKFSDAEAAVNDPVTGTSWVALEGIAQIWRFDAAGARTGRLRNPVMFRWPANGGTESLARLPDGRFLAMSERRVKNGMHEGVLFSGDPVRPGTPYLRFFYDSRALGAVTDAAALPDGRILILHRKLGLVPIFTASIAIADPRGLRSDDVLTARPLATISDRRLTENYEGLAIEQGPDGLALWLVSDDNINEWQRTRLLRFRIDAAALQPTSTGSANSRAAKRAAPSPVRP